MRKLLRRISQKPPRRPPLLACSRSACARRGILPLLQLREASHVPAHSRRSRSQPGRRSGPAACRPAGATDRRTAQPAARARRARPVSRRARGTRPGCRSVLREQQLTSSSPDSPRPGGGGNPHPGRRAGSRPAGPAATTCGSSQASPAPRWNASCSRAPRRCCWWSRRPRRRTVARWPRWTSRCATRAMQCARQLLDGDAELHALHVHEMAEVHARTPRVWCCSRSCSISWWRISSSNCRKPVRC